MLGLTRKVGQGVVIDGDIRVVVLDIESGGTVRLGFEAPPEVEIWRDELEKEIYGPPGPDRSA
jgi:carbon storage regulator